MCGFFLLLIVDGILAPPFPSPDFVYVLAVPDDFRMSKYPGGSSSSSGGNGIVSASPSATTAVAIRSKRILLLSRC